MKKIALLFVLACLPPLRAENWLQNGDFADGTAHWRGNGRTPADMSADADPFAKPDPLLSKGLILPLRGRSWTTITQNFRTKAAQLVLKVTYVLSPGLAFSNRDEDYNNVAHQIDNPLYANFNIAKLHWIALFTDFGNGARGTYYTVDCHQGSTAPQTITCNVSNLTPLENELVTIAFPPGTGNVVLQNVSLTDN